MVEHNLAKVDTRVRFPSPAPKQPRKTSLTEVFFYLRAEVILSIEKRSRILFDLLILHAHLINV